MYDVVMESEKSTLQSVGCGRLNTPWEGTALWLGLTVTLLLTVPLTACEGVASILRCSMAWDTMAGQGMLYRFESIGSCKPGTFPAAASA